MMNILMPKIESIRFDLLLKIIYFVLLHKVLIK